MQDNEEVSVARRRRSRSISDNATPDVKFAFYGTVYCDDVRAVSANMTSLRLHNPVFERMFFGPLAEPTTKTTIYDVNIKSEALKFCMRNISYENLHIETTEEMTERIQLLDAVLETERYRKTITEQLGNDVTAAQCLYTSRVYLLDRLQGVCITSLTQSFRTENVSSIYSLAYGLGIAELKDLCIEYMSEESDDVLFCPDFLDISREVLCDLLGNNHFLAEEKMLFDAATRWSVGSCSDLTFEDLKSYASIIRKKLGKGLYNIRFPLLPRGILDHQIHPSGILSKEDLQNIEQKFNNKERSVEILFDAAAHVLPNMKLQAWDVSDTVLFDSSIDLKLHSLKTKNLRGNIVDIEIIKILKETNRSVPKQSLKAGEDWLVNELQEIRFTQPPLLKSRFMNCVIIKTDPSTVYTCLSGITRFKIRGVKTTATYFTNNFVSAILSPSTYLAPTFSSDESSEGNL